MTQGFSPPDRADTPGISIILCSYNGAARIRPTLDALAKCETDCPVEVVFVDNRSTDGVAEVARAHWSSAGNGEIPLHVVDEPRQGLAFARRAGIALARYSLLLFCDDDNWLDRRYLTTARGIMAERPDVGVLGGQALPAYEVPPPRWFVKNRHAFALGPQATDEGDLTETRCWVWGAGLVVRAAALRELDRASISPVATGRQGSKMTSGEEVEMCLYLRVLGWRIWYSPRLTLQHYMPASRFNRRRFRSLTFLNGVFDSVVQYPLRSGRGRFRNFASASRLYAWRLRQASTDVPPTLYYTGQIYGIVCRRRQILQVYDNKRKLQALRRIASACTHAAS